MSNNPKYICVDSLVAGPTYILFPAWLAHADVANMLFPDQEVLSAGNLSFSLRGLPVASGRSVSLGVESRPEDSDGIADQFGIDPI